MSIPESNNHGRVRKSSTRKANQAIDQTIIQHIRQYKNLGQEEITQRLQELRREWDIEKTLEVNASSLALIGLLLGTYANKKWYILPGVVLSFLLQHGLQGWCPPLPLFRALGVRTRQEIDEERYALKVLRGDFDEVSAASEPAEILEIFRR